MHAKILYMSSRTSIIFLHRVFTLIQERALALAENRPLPALHSSVDVRPLSMDDFKFAHEQVGIFATGLLYH